INKNLENKDINNLDDEIVSKEDIENLTKNTDKNQDDTIKNNGINPKSNAAASTKQVDKLNSTVDDEVTTKPEDLKP
ncbi:hypothetical protein QTH09_18885, partial [Clostridium perfringens]|nr:hypothetical protein [Clostridium perfringens]